MAKSPTYERGDWLALCDSCGRKFQASQLKKRWDGLMVCDSDWEPRQPQDFVRAKIDIQAVPWSRPEPSDNFILACSTRSSIAGYASAGCAIASNSVDPGLVPPPSFIPEETLVDTCIVWYAITGYSIIGYVE